MTRIDTAAFRTCFTEYFIGTPSIRSVSYYRLFQEESCQESIKILKKSVLAAAGLFPGKRRTGTSPVIHQLKELEREERGLVGDRGLEPLTSTVCRKRQKNATCRK
jgi:hypothetical protein